MDNLLPYDGLAYYYGQILSPPEASEYYKELLNNIDWRHDESFIFGKHYITKRKYAWHGDRPFEYAYSNTLKVAQPWTSALKKLKHIAEKVTQETYNSCLLNLYHNGAEGMAYHSDGEKDLKENGAIASLSFGAERKFLFRHNESKETVSVELENGSLLLMGGVTQKFWKHRLPPTKKVSTPRINLTFRTIVTSAT